MDRRVRGARSIVLALPLACAAVLAPGGARAQALDGQPFRTLSAEPLALGEHSLEVGAEWRSGIVPVPLLSPVEGDLVQAPEVRWRIGFGRAELMVTWPAWQSFSPEPALLDDEDETGDSSFWVNVQAIRQLGGRPAFGVALGAKLPNASATTGLGTDESDVFAALVLSHDGPRHDVRFNAGVAILGDPIVSSSQEDLLTWGLAARFGGRHALLAEAWGRMDTSDDPRDLDEATARLGYGLFLRRTTISLSLLHGLEDVSGDVGAELGVGWILGSAR